MALGLVLLDVVVVVVVGVVGVVGVMVGVGVVDEGEVGWREGDERECCLCPNFFRRECDWLLLFCGGGSGSPVIVTLPLSKLSNNDLFDVCGLAPASFRNGEEATADGGLLLDGLGDLDCRCC